MTIKRSISIWTILFMLSAVMPSWAAPALAADGDSDTGIRHMELRLTDGTPIGVEKIDDTHYLVGNLYGITTARLKPTLSDPRAKVEVDGVEVNDEGWIMIDLALGDNIYAIRVTAVDGTIKMYELEIPRIIDDVAILRDLALSDGVVPVLDPSNPLLYSANVHYSRSSLTVTPTTRALIATVTVNGKVVKSGEPSDRIDLDVGSNTIEIKVTAENGVDSLTYTLTVTRAPVTTHTVVFDYQGGTPIPSLTDVVWGSTIGEPPAPVASGYKFVGWYRDAGHATPWDFATDKVTDNITLYSKWLRTYTVTFNSQGGSPVASLTDVAEGSKISAPEEPTKDGFSLMHWYFDANNRFGYWDFGGNRVTSDLTLYANWTATNDNNLDEFYLYLLTDQWIDIDFDAGQTDYTIDFYGDNTVWLKPIVFDERKMIKINGVKAVSGIKTPVSLELGHHNIEISVTAIDGSTRTYTLAYRGLLSNNANLRDLTLSNGTVPVGDMFNRYSADVAYDVDRIKVIPTASNAGATITVNGAVVASGVESQEINLNVGPNTITIIVTAENGETTVESKLTVTRAPSGVKYSVDFDSRGGSPVERLAAVDEDTLISEPDAPIRDGYTFDGWYKETSYATSWSFDKDTVKANTILYAKWTAVPATYTVSFSVAGGSPVPRVTGVISGSLISEPEPPTRDGWTFAGWYHTDARIEKWDFNTDRVTANTTLYAKWTSVPPATYMVVFNSHGGSAVPSVTGVSSGSTIGEPDAPMRSGYLFAGWYSNETYEAAWEFDTDKVTANITLHAKWTLEALPQPVLAADGGDKSVSLTWNDMEGAVSYRIYRSTASGVYDSLPVATVNAPSASYEVTGLTNGTVYYFVVAAVNADGIGTPSNEAVATPLSSNANLERLAITGASLPFEPTVFTYRISVGNGVNNVKVTPTAAEGQATISVNGTAVTSGRESGFIDLRVGSNLVEVEVTAQDGETVLTYSLTIIRAESTTANSETPIAVTPDKAVTVIVPLGVENANVSVAPVLVDDKKEAMLPLLDVQAATPLGNVSVTIAEGTKITAPASWDGTIKLPEAQSASSVSIPSASVDAVIKIGSFDVGLLFDRAVRLLIPNQGGKSAGFVQGGVFKAITGTISADTQEAADREIAAGGDAVLTVGGDLVIWTKHFTQFAAYTKIVPDSGSPGESSGGGPADPSVTIHAATGGTATLKGVRVQVPAGAMDGLIKIMVDQVKDVPALPQDGNLQLAGDAFEVRKDKAGTFGKPVVLTLPYDKSKVDLDKTTLALYGYNTSARSWAVLDNQSIDEKNGTVSGSTLEFAIFAVLASDREKEEQPPTDEAVFADLKGHWSEANVRELVMLGAIKGYPDNTFRPNASVTRAEFVTSIVKAFRLDARNGQPFADTAGHWAKDAIATAVAAGLVNGYSDGRFGPDDALTREQMAWIVVRVAELAEKTNGGVSFTDSSDISYWARTALATAIVNGLIKGYEDGSVRPNAHATRAEAVAVMIRALSL